MALVKPTTRVKRMHATRCWLQKTAMGTGLLVCLLALVTVLFQAPCALAKKNLPYSVTAETVRLLQDDAYFSTLIPALQTAKKRIDIAMFLFKINDYPDNRPTMIVRELTRAVQRGVRVQVLLERSKKNKRLNITHARVGETLAKAGITVRFDSPRVTSHGKLVIIDSRLVFMGSHNFTHSALTWNHELSVLIEDNRLARRLLDTVF